MKKIMLYFCMILVSSTCASEESFAREIGENIPTYEIKFLNANSKSMHGKKVRVTGYIQAGFDGWDNVCQIATNQGLDDVKNVIWINSDQCEKLRETMQFKEGEGVVIGEFRGADEVVYISGMLVNSELLNAVIYWGGQLEP